MSPSSFIKVGLITVMVTILLFLGMTYWVKTRTFTPVNVPVLLGTGESKTVEFKINLRGDYAVYFDMDESADEYTPGKCSRKNYWDSHWNVYRLRGGTPKRRELWASSEPSGPGGWPYGGFHASPGGYEVEWKAPSEPACLNVRHPRLFVSTDPQVYEERTWLLQCACIFFGGAGVILMLRGVGSGLLGLLPKRGSLRIFPDLVLRNVLPLRRHRPMVVMNELPHFPLLCCCLLSVLMFILMIYEMPQMHHGLLVNFGKPPTAVYQRSPSTETLGVYIDSPDEFFVNGERVGRQELPTKLKEELGKRIVWTVYLEAEENIRFSEAVYAMDTIQGLGAKLVWLTPRTREEFNRRASQ